MIVAVPEKQVNGATCNGIMSMFGPRIASILKKASDELWFDSTSGTKEKKVIESSQKAGKIEQPANNKIHTATARVLIVGRS